MRPSDTARSYIVVWKGNKPVIEESNWAVGYTPGHQPTPEEALAWEASAILKATADIREKWLNLTLKASQMQGQATADAFGQLIDLTVTPDMNEQIAEPFPPGSTTVHEGAYDDHQDH